MRHVIIRAVPTVSDKDVGKSVRGFQAVYHSAESPEFVPAVDGLDESILICMRIKVIERVEVDTVEALCGMALGNEIVLRGPLRPAEKGEGRAVNSEAPVIRRRLQSGKGTVELPEGLFQSLRPKLVPLLVECGKERGIRSEVKEIVQLITGAGNPSGDKEGDKHLRGKLSAPGEILIRVDQIRGDVGCDMEESIPEQRFDLVKKHGKNFLGLE